MMKKLFAKFLSLKYGLLIVIIGVASISFMLGTWWTKQGPNTFHPPENPQEKQWIEQGVLLNTDGIYFVGSIIDPEKRIIAPGIYRTTGKGTSLYGCKWRRLSGFEAETDKYIARYIEDLGKPTIVEIKADDAGFQTTGCGKWHYQTVAVTEDKTSFKDGAYIVGQDIEPGTYYAQDAQWGCSWERLSGFSGEYRQGRPFGTDSELIATSSNNVVTIKPEDKGFISFQCKQWIKAPID